MKKIFFNTKYSWLVVVALIQINLTTAQKKDAYQMMVSDVKVGVLLSAGLDSTSVARVLKNNDYNNIETFNVGVGNSILTS